MRVIKKLLVILTIILILSGCHNNETDATVNTTEPDNTVATDSGFTTTPPRTEPMVTPVATNITVEGRTYSIEEIQQGILTAMNTDFYYAIEDDPHLNRKLIEGKSLEYDLVFDGAHNPPYVLMIVNNLNHPLATEERPLYQFGVAFTKRGMEEKLYTHGTTTADMLTYQLEANKAVYLGSGTLQIDQFVKPQHEQMSEEWKQRAASAIQLYMDENDFYSEQEKNLEPGAYDVYVKGFAAGDENARIVFVHENGNIYEGFYYFVHDTSGQRAASLNHVSLVEDFAAYYEEWLNKIKENAALHIEYIVQ